MSKAKKAAKQKPGKVMRSIPTGIKRIIGLDLSLRSTGWSTCDLETGTVLWGALENKLTDVERLDWILKEIQTLLAQGKPSTTVVVIEDFVNSFKAGEIGMLHGIVRLFLYRCKVPIWLVTPTQLKKWVVGKSMAEKELIIKYIEKRYGYDCDQNDTADAIGLMTIRLPCWAAILARWRHSRRKCLLRRWRPRFRGPPQEQVQLQQESI